MDISALSIPSGPSLSSASLNAASGPSVDSALEDFEGVFVSMMIKEMRKSAGDGFFGGDSADAMGGLFDMTLGEELGRQGALGIASALGRYREVAEGHSSTIAQGGTE